MDLISEFPFDGVLERLDEEVRRVTEEVRKTGRRRPDHSDSGGQARGLYAGEPAGPESRQPLRVRYPHGNCPSRLAIFTTGDFSGRREVSSLY